MQQNIFKVIKKSTKDNHPTEDLSLTHRHESPHDRGCGEAGKDIVSVGEVCEVWHDDRLTPTLTPHVHLGDKHC